MRHTIIFGHDEKVAAWVARQLPDMDGGFGACRAVAICVDDKPVAGVVYHDYHERFGTVQMSIASTTPLWATPTIICDVLAIPFFQYKCQKVCAMTASDNARTIRFLSRRGWTREAILAHQFGRKRHAHVFRMLDTEYIGLRARLLGSEMKEAA